jgi:hypothetical protein
MRVLCIPMLCLVAVGCAHAAGTSPQATPIDSSDAMSPEAFSNPSATAEEAAARKLVEKLSSHDFSGATADFGGMMKAGASVENLEKDWTQWEKVWGSLVKIEEVHGQPYSKGWAVLVTCRFDLGVHTLSVSFDPSGKINGLSNSPVITAAIMFMDALGYHHPELADALSDSNLHDAAPTEKLGQVWSEIETSLGEYRGVREISDKGAYALVVVAFRHGKPTFNVAVDLRGKVTAFHVVGSGEQPGAGPNPTQ